MLNHRFPVLLSLSQKEALIENDFLENDQHNSNNPAKRGFLRQKRNCSLPQFAENRRFNFFAKASSCDDDITDESMGMLSSPESTGEHQRQNHSINKSNSTYDSIHDYENVQPKNNSFLVVNQNTIEELSSSSNSQRFGSKPASSADPSLKDSSNSSSLAMRSLKRVLGSKVGTKRDCSCDAAPLTLFLF